MNISVPFACPVHKVNLDPDLFCEKCKLAYPLAGTIPILLNESNSVFRISDYLKSKVSYEGASSYAGSQDKRAGLRQLYRQLMHKLSESEAPKRNFDVNDAIAIVLSNRPSATVLVIGAGDRTVKCTATYTDVAYGKNVSCIADAHDLPFQGETFDACVICAVLEHVVDPHRCVQEIERVLKPGSFVFAETPFMQPVHMGAYDFTRFTYLGHRRLFRRFDEIKSGMSGGAGVSTNQIFRYAIVSLSDNPNIKKWLRLIAFISTYPLRWIDYFSFKNQSAYDSASGFYFFGTLRTEPIADVELLKLFRGGI